MMVVLGGIFIILHGLVHLWYFALSRSLVTFQPEMGWSGTSWLFTNLTGASSTRLLASVVYALAALVLVVSGAGMVAEAGWWRLMLAGSAVFSSAIIILFWDGQMQQLVEKGLLGLVINLVILGALFVLR